LSDCAVRCIAR